ncbi:MAG: ATP-grasp domain-containing protein [Planctomycetales bacterium]|nr:ATP-grasp domain-containing protein [Planctomycetales bacterium]
MSRKLRVVALVDPELVPPDTIVGVSDEDMADWKMEYDVRVTLEDLGHEVVCLGLEHLGQLAEVQRDFRPHIVFNMLEEFHGAATYEPMVVGHLELLRLPYTGCNPQGLLVAHDKALAKHVLRGAGIPTPPSRVFERTSRAAAGSISAKSLNFPLLVKSTVEDASLGIATDSVVHSERELRRRVQRVHDDQCTDALVEEFIEGRELYVGTLGNQRPTALPVWELRFRRLPPGTPNIATADVKWDGDLQKEWGVMTERAKLPAAWERRLQSLARRVHRTLGISGYARMDFRVTASGEPYVLEANPNPNLSYGEDYAESADAAGLDYESLLQRILNLGLSYPAAWKRQLV